MNEETYRALKDLIAQLEKIGLAKMNKLGEGNISTFVTVLKMWIDEVAKEYEDKCGTCGKLHAETCTHGIDWHLVCKPCIPF